MGLRKEDDANLRQRYPIYVEIGMIAALLILITAFRIGWGGGPQKTFDMNEQETVNIKEVQQTQQKKQPPPPPRPPVPIEKPDDQVLENENLDFDATLDLNETLTKTTNKMPEQPKEEEKEEVVPFAVIEEKPQLKGGQEALYDALEYPSFAKRANIEGTVFLQFVVDKQGNVKDVTVLRSPHEALAKAAIEAMKQMSFTPGKQRKQPVEVRMSQPIRFKLQ